MKRGKLDLGHKVMLLNNYKDLCNPSRRDTKIFVIPIDEIHLKKGRVANVLYHTFYYRDCRV